MRFFDGTQLGIKSTAIKFIDQNGKHSRYIFQYNTGQQVELSKLL